MSVVSGLLLLGACGNAGTSEVDDGVGLPDRQDPPDRGDTSVPMTDGAQASDSARPDVITDAGADSDAGGGLRIFASSSTTTGNIGGLIGGFGCAWIAGTPRLFDDWREKTWGILAGCAVALTAYSFLRMFLNFNRMD